MAYQFSCPQGHILQGELSTVGQIMRCPVCGSDFHVPPPDAGAMISQGFIQGPGMWPTTGTPSAFSFPVSEQLPAGGYPPPPSPAYGAPGTMPGMTQPQNMPGGPFAPPAFPAPRPPESPAAPSAGANERPRFDLGFDPFAKAALPFELSGHGEADAGGNASVAPPSSSSSFLAGPAPVASEPATALPIATRDDFLAGPATMSEKPPETALPPKMLHIRCPSGHVVKAPSDLLGKLGRCPACEKTFELRYENSLEFKRRTEKILRRDENEAGRAWLGWTFVAAFLVFVALVGAVLIWGR